MPDQSVENNDRQKYSLQVFKKIKKQNVSVSFDRITPRLSKTPRYLSVCTESGQSNQCYTNMQFL